MTWDMLRDLPFSAIKFAFGSTICADLLLVIFVTLRKRISMKILVICVINSPGHRK